MPAPTADDLIERFGPPDDVAQCEPNLNPARVAWARKVYLAFIEEVTNYTTADALHPDVLDEQLPDLICDLLHLACHEGREPINMLDRGWMHFTAEAGLGYTQ